MIDDISRSSLSCQGAALQYATNGTPVFPVHGKVPYLRSRGFHDATTDLDIIRWWWRRWPDANVAVPTGSPSSWTVLDVDGHHGGFTSLSHIRAMLRHRLDDLHQEGHEAIPATQTSQTGGGYHLIFQSPTQEMRNTVAYAGLPGIDIRGEGGYIVVPPSLHPSGRRYLWLTLIPPAPFPDLLLDLLQQRERLHEEERQRSHPTHFAQKPKHDPATHSRRTDPEFWVAKAVTNAREGTRHKYALWLACRLIEQGGLSPQQAEPYLRQYVDQVPGGHEDYPLADALNCLAWATTHV